MISILLHYLQLLSILICIYSITITESNHFKIAATTSSPTRKPTLKPSQTNTPSPTMTPLSSYAPSSNSPIITAAPTSWFGSVETNPNPGQLVTSSDKNFTTMSMIYTFVICIILFLFLLIFFEFNRHYKQIFLKRYQKRFIDIGQVPPQPPDSR